MLSSSLKTASVFALAVASAAFASPTAPPPEIVPTSVCTTITTGILHTSSLPISNAPNLSVLGDDLAFGGLLEVEFQSCQPNFGNFAGPDQIGGHIYIPMLQLCLTAKAVSAGPPFEFGVGACGFTDDSSQDPQQFVQEADGTIYYAGGTQADGSYNFWGCSTGFFGLDSTQTSGAVALRCTSEANTIGLRIESTN